MLRHRNLSLAERPMPFRYRRSLRLAPGLRVNLSKTGASVSVGGRGFTRNISRRGVRTTVGLPGGPSYSTARRTDGSWLGGLIVIALLIALVVHLMGG
jgi:Protein of unknown function (DUF4236)